MGTVLLFAWGTLGGGVRVLSGVIVVAALGVDVGWFAFFGLVARLAAAELLELVAALRVERAAIRAAPAAPAASGRHLERVRRAHDPIGRALAPQRCGHDLGPAANHDWRDEVERAGPGRGHGAERSIRRRVPRAEAHRRHRPARRRRVIVGAHFHPYTVLISLCCRTTRRPVATTTGRHIRTCAKHWTPAKSHGQTELALGIKQRAYVSSERPRLPPGGGPDLGCHGDARSAIHTQLYFNTVDPPTRTGAGVARLFLTFRVYAGSWNASGSANVTRLQCALMSRRTDALIHSPSFSF